MKEQAFSNLLDMKDVLDSLAIPFFLDGGTLLGAYRDKDFCEDDEDDIDIATYAKYQTYIPDVIERAKKAGFVVHRHWSGDMRAPGKAQEVALIKHHNGKPLKIDFMFYERKGSKAWCGIYDKDDHLIPRVIPYKHIKRLDTIMFRGAEFWTPSDLEAYLTHCYGDWRTPKHRRDYSCYNPNDLRALQPDFEFWK